MLTYAIGATAKKPTECPWQPQQWKCYSEVCPDFKAFTWPVWALLMLTFHLPRTAMWLHLIKGVEKWTLDHVTQVGKTRIFGKYH